MNYIGSKFRLSGFILQTVMDIVGDIQSAIFCDLFAGTGIVGRTFKEKGCQVIANDTEYYSYVLNRNYIANNGGFAQDNHIELLNNLEGIEGFVFENYCQGGDAKRNYFADHNGKKIDHIRTWIDEQYQKKTITDDQYYFLLCSLIESADKVANTASVYAAFLKHMKKEAQKDLILEPAHFSPSSQHKVFQSDANKLISKIKGDILYLDPPYNARQYGNYYHILNTLAEYKPVKLRGKTGMRDYTKSKYCSRKKVREAFDELIRKSKFKYIFLSYNNEGLMSLEDIQSIMSQYGTYSFETKKYQRFKADSSKNRQHKASSTTEYLHILKK